ncbi:MULTISPECIES: hypothetical protein [unclassified Streptomyces]|nr:MULTISPECIES: hypothetical protein [unclassified Streptomyces]
MPERTGADGSSPRAAAHANAAARLPVITVRFGRYRWALPLGP